MSKMDIFQTVNLLILIHIQRAIHKCQKTHLFSCFPLFLLSLHAVWTLKSGGGKAKLLNFTHIKNPSSRATVYMYD